MSTFLKNTKFSFAMFYRKTVPVIEENLKINWGKKWKKMVLFFLIKKKSLPPIECFKKSCPSFWKLFFSCEAASSHILHHRYFR